MPIHLHWRYIALVFVGGALGTTARYLLQSVIPPWFGLPLSTFLINVSGAFFLGFLLEALAVRGPDEGRRRDLRLFIGTGILGGFTTYSAFAVDTDGLFDTANPWGGVVYALATILVGAAATLGGIALAARRRGPTGAPASPIASVGE